MLGTGHSFHRGSHAAEWIKSILRRRMREAIGVGLLALALVTALALATWSIQDPSLSHATAAPARNLFGKPGAMLSDLVMQLFGLASLIFVLVPAIWGWRLLNHRAFDREVLRALAWPPTVVLASGAAACLPRLVGWPLPTGLGGAVGDGMLRLVMLFAGAFSALGFLVTGLVMVALAFIGFAVAAGWGAAPLEDEAPLPADDEAAPMEDDEEDRGVSIGWFVHIAYSLRAQAMRLVARLRESFAAQPAPAPMAARREPQMGALAPSFAPADHDAPLAGPDLSAEDDDADEEELEQDDDAEEAEAAPAPRKRKAPAPRAAKKGAPFALPAVNLLVTPRYTERAALSADALAEHSKALESVLQDFGVRGEIIKAHPGPVVTLYELEPAPGIKSSRVIGLADDIARSMSAVSARVAVVPGRNAIGIELPNPTREKVFLRELLTDEAQAGVKLPLCLGKTIGGDPVVTDLARMPHLLIAGTTGSGKSVAINTMILSLVYRLRPDQCRLIMVDPKMLELSVYDGIPHLLAPVVTDPKKAVVALKWAVREMEDRYKKMAKLGVRNIDGYNVRLTEAAARGEALVRTVHTGYDKETGKAIYEEEPLDLEPLPYIVVIVDEMADLMMVAGKDIEGAIQRLAQMARAAGIHVILATQRPSVDVITGTIKANFPTRISFQVTSKIDSRTILGEQGAEQLLGQGDMLYMAGGGRISRVHGPFVSDDEVEKVVRHLKAQGVPQYLEAVTAEEEPEAGEDGAVFDGTGMGMAGDATDLYQQAVQVVMRDHKASTSYIQRRLQIGYNRAASIMERMEQEGVVGPANHAGKREILLGQEEHESI